jgi:hypothetical protein
MLSIPSGIQTLVESGRFAVRLMIRVDLDDGPQGLWNDLYDVTVDDCTFVGIGGNLQTDAFSGSAALDVDNLDFQITGLSSEARALVDNENWHQRSASVFIAFLDDAGAVQHTMVRYSGFLDSCQVVDQADGLSLIHVIIENSNRALDLSTGRVRSDADQRSVGGSTDGFGKYITSANSQAGEITWGRKGPHSPVR